MERIDEIIEESKATAQRQVGSCATRISKLDKQIEELQERKRKLTAAKRQHSIVVLLKEEGGSAWEKLSNKNKWKKENVLATFRSVKPIPRQLKEEFWRENAPEELVDDRDILIARASRMFDFSIFYTRYHGNRIPVFRVPEALLGDAEVVAAVTKHYPKVLTQEDLHDEIFDNDEVFHAFTTRSDSNYLYRDKNSPFHTALSRFSPRICGNCANMLQAAKQGLDVSRCIAGNLVQDKQFALDLAAQAEFVFEEGLGCFSDRLKADREVVLAFVQRNGLCLKNASLSLRRDDLEIVCAASDCKPASLQFCVEGPVKQKLGSDRAFMLDAIRRRWRYSDHASSLYAMLSPSLKMDLELIVASRKSRCLDASDLPGFLSEDPEFWKTVIAESCNFWSLLPDQFKHEVAFVRCIKGFSDSDTGLVGEIVAAFPALAEDVAFWSDCVLGEDSELYGEELRDLITELGPDLLNDRELMLRACGRSCELLEEVPSEFSLDREFVEAAIDGDPWALQHIPFDTQSLYPELVATAIANLDDDVNEYSDSVNPELWENLVVAQAWFEEGGEVHEEIPERCKENRDYCLMVVKNSGAYTMEEFVCQRFKRDKSFIMEATKRNGVAYVMAEGGLETDYDCTLAGFGSEEGEDLVDFFVEAENDHALAYFHSFLKTVQEKLSVHDAFVRGVLCGMSEFSGPHCHLPLLQQDNETSLALKKLLAEYLGVPPANELPLLRQASTTLQMLPEPDESDEMCTCPRCIFGAVFGSLGMHL